MSQDQAKAIARSKSKIKVLDRKFLMKEGYRYRVHGKREIAQKPLHSGHKDGSKLHIFGVSEGHTGEKLDRKNVFSSVNTLAIDYNGSDFGLDTLQI